MAEFKSWAVWDAGIRWFHWINVLCVLGLAGLGLAILNSKALGVSTEGKILLEGRHLSTLTTRERSRLRRDRIGFVFQAYNLIPVLTARENVEFVMVARSILETPPPCEAWLL